MESLKIQALIGLLVFLSSRALSLPSWVQPSPSLAYISLQRELSLKSGDFFKRVVRRVGNNTIDLEGYAALGGTLHNFYEIAKDVPSYRQWALNGINQKPGGGKYLVQILDLKPHPKRTHVLGALFGINFPGIQAKVEKDFLIHVGKDRQSVTVACESLQVPDLILSSLHGFITAFEAPKKKERLWIYFKGRALLRSWLLYQALPEKLLSTESSERIQTVLDNFTGEEIKKPFK